MADLHLPHVNVSKLTLPISMLTTIIGGAAWLTTTRADVNHLQVKVDSHIEDFKKSRLKSEKQGEVISEMNGKLDILLKQMQTMERRLNQRPPPRRRE